MKHGKTLSLGSSMVALAVGVTIATSACTTSVLDLGENVPKDAASPALPALAEAGVTPSAYGCAEWIDDEVRQERFGACGAECGSALSETSLFPLDSKKNVVAGTAGQWLRCSGSFGPDDTVGVEFAPGCRLYFLQRDVNGQFVRGTVARLQAKFDIHDPRPTGQARKIDVHFPDDRHVTYELEVGKCPSVLRMTSTENGTSRTVEFTPATREDPAF
jgi:hypothetical protein